MPRGSAEEMDSKCVRRGARGGPGQGTAPLRSPESRSPSAGVGGGPDRPPGSPRPRCRPVGAAGVGGGRGGFAPPFSPGWRGGLGPGRGGRAERGGRGGLGRPRGRAAGSMTGLCLSCLLWVRPAAPAPGGTGGGGGSRTAARWGAGSGVSERGWSGERAVDGADYRGGGRGGGGTTGTERGCLHRDGRTGSGGNRRCWTRTGT